MMPITMRAAAFDTPGSPEVLRIHSLPVPEPGEGQVRIRVLAAGVQPYDAAIRSGWTPPEAVMRYPVVPGNEFAGIVDLVGPGTIGWVGGEEVLGYQVLGSYAEYIVVHADQIVRKPKHMPWEIAGGLSGASQTAHTALQLLKVGEGDTVLIHAAAGAVGTMAVQLAKLWGARAVIGTASVRNHAYLRELGAIPVTYGEGLADRVRAVAPDGIDAVLDGAGGDALNESIKVAKDKQRIGTLVEFGLAEKLGARIIFSQRSASRLSEVVQLFAAGKLRLPIRRTYTLEQAADAHREVEKGHGYGKVVLRIGS